MNAAPVPDVDETDRDHLAYEAGHRDAMALCRAMFEHGIDIGRAQAQDEENQAWAEALGTVQDQARAFARRTRAELDARRYPGYSAERLAELRDQARQRFGLPLGGR